MSHHPENTNPAETFAALTKSDPKVAHLVGNHFSKPASAERVNAAKAGLEKNGFKVYVVNTRDDAFETIKTMIPAVCLTIFTTYVSWSSSSLSTNCGSFS